MAMIATSAVEIFGQGIFNVEGVAVDRDGNVYGGGRDCVMYKVSPDGTVNKLATLPQGGAPNGVTLDRAGNVIYCDLTRNAMMAITPSGKVSLLADEVGGLKLSMPNFALFDAQGRLFITNSCTQSMEGLRGEFVNPAPNGSLVCLRGDGKGEVVAKGLYCANGLAIDPKEEALYVLQSTRNDCLRIALKKDGSFGKPEVFSENFPAFPDGMAFDALGNLYVVLPGRVIKDRVSPAPAQGGAAPKAEVGGKPDSSLGDVAVPANTVLKIDGSGRWQVLIDDPQGTRLSYSTNCAFGGPDMKDLYFSNLRGTHFSRVRLDVAGHPLYHQR